MGDGDADLAAWLADRPADRLRELLLADWQGREVARVPLAYLLALVR